MTQSSNKHGIITWRRAVLSDISLVLELIEKYYACDGLEFKKAKSERALCELLTHPNLGEVLLIIEDCNVAGYIALTNGFSLEYGGSYQFIDEFFILESFRGRRLGTETLKYVESQGAQNNITSLSLEVGFGNIAAQKLYESRGFEDSGRHLWSKNLLQ
jgi:GNAT superfamily N-acetyltransferase